MKEPADADVGSVDRVFRLEDFLPFRLSVASEVVTQLIVRRYLTHSDLAMAEWRLLSAVGRYGVLSPTMAGECTAMDKVKVSRAAASLVARGLLRQTHDPKDGRGRLLRLTRKGAPVYAGLAPTAAEIDAALMLGLTRAEWASLHKSLRKLSEHAQSLLAEAEAG